LAGFGVTFLCLIQPLHILRLNEFSFILRWSHHWLLLAAIDSSGSTSES
jgi:hypothetical protein